MFKRRKDIPTLGRAVIAGRQFGRLLLRQRLPRLRKAKVGAPPGLRPQDLAQMPPGPGTVEVTCIDYAPNMVHVQRVEDVPAFIAAHRPEGAAVRWINVAGLSDPQIIRSFASKYNLHPLAVEDVLHVPQRPKVDPFAAEGAHQARLFVIARMIQLNNEHVTTEQLSIFLGHNTVLTFQETSGDVWNQIRQRINTPGSHLRLNDGSYLVYALLDAIIDHCFPILEKFSLRMEELEERVTQRADREMINEIYNIKRELLLLERQIWPIREVVSALQREQHECLSENTKVYLRDVADHCVQILELVETYRELASGIADTHLAIMSLHMNEVIKVLTVYAAIFIPVTFLASVYGMNFEYQPEFGWQYGYHAFWLISIAISVGMLWWFRRRRWI